MFSRSKIKEESVKTWGVATWLAAAWLLSACSQGPAGGLGAQFGTPKDDYADAVVNDPERGHTYVGGVSNTNYGEYGGTIFLRRYTQDGSLAWKRLISVASDSVSEPYPGSRGEVSATGLDGSGNVYLGWSRNTYESYAREAFISKYSPAGTLLYQLYVAPHLHDFEVDAAGNLYVAAGSYDEHPIGARERFYLRKYDPRARLLWERLRAYDSDGFLIDTPQTIPAPYDVALASNGALYVTGVNGNSCCGDESGPELSKYSSAGVTLWERPRAYGYAVLTTAAQNVYVASRQIDGPPASTLLQKFDTNGTLRWQRTLAVAVDSLAVDAARNLYAGGRSGAENADYFVRKYSPAGLEGWTYAPGRPDSYDSIRGVSARGRGGVYAAGFTNGPVSGRGSAATDAVLLRLDAQGRQVWER